MVPFTELDLCNEIERLSNCKGTFKIDFIPSDVDQTVILKEIPLLLSNSQKAIYLKIRHHQHVSKRKNRNDLESSAILFSRTST